MHNSLENKVAVITGAYGDIGFSICKKFAEKGINLAILGKDLERLELKKKYLDTKYATLVGLFYLEATNHEYQQSQKNKIFSIFKIVAN